MLKLRSALIFLCKIVTLSLPLNAAACIWNHGGTEESINIEMGDIFVPRDAPFGSIIGRSVSATASSGFRCIGTRIGLHVANHNALGSALVIINGNHIHPTPLGATPIYKTSTEGVGVILTSDSFAQNASTVPQGGHLGSISNVMPLYYGTIANTPLMNYDVRYDPPTITAQLVYLGRLSSGHHSISKPMPQTVLDAETISIGDRTISHLYLTINGSITVSDCQLPASSNQIEVQIGAFTRNIFNGKGSTSSDVNFQIPLTNCVAGTFPTPGLVGNYFQTSNANIRLEGSNGSAILDAQEGILGLNTDSDASGVAVQVLKADGSKLELGRDIPITRLNDGVINLDFKARYIQTSELSTGPEPGTANASANFTITYK